MSGRAGSRSGRCPGPARQHSLRRTGRLVVLDTLAAGSARVAVPGVAPSPFQVDSLAACSSRGPESVHPCQNMVAAPRKLSPEATQNV